MQTKVYLDFGDGPEDISAYVKYETLIVSQRAFNDTYHYAQNEASFSVIYDATLYNKIITNTDPIKVTIASLKSSPCLTTEDGAFITTEDDKNICAEQDVLVPMFYGTIPPTKSRSYNGILDNIIIALEATDDLKDLEVPVGDVLYADHTLCNPLDPTTSIVHKLCAIAGKTVSAFAPTLTVLFPRWAPDKEDDTVLTTLDTLLYEYGFTLNMDATGYVEPIRWLYPETALPVYTFDDTNIINSIDIKDSIKNYDGAEVIYYELSEADKILLYRDGKPPYADNGGFQGYPVLAGTTYPPETNVIDETTGLPQVVYQEYSDDAITYWTNKAIKENLDYYWKAFESDFSSILATENHFRDASVDVGLVVTVQEFQNKKCRIIYNNPTAGSLRIYYNNVYGDVWYRSSERKSVIENVDSPLKMNKYSSKFIFEKQYADNLVSALASQYENQRTVYTFPSAQQHPAGALVRLTISEGTDVTCIIAGVTYDERNQLYQYTLMGYGLAREELTYQTSTLSVQINPTYTYGYQLAIGTPAAVQATATVVAEDVAQEVVEDNIPVLAPQYRRIVVPNSTSSPIVQPYTVTYSAPNYVFTPATTLSVNPGDWAFVRHYSGDTADTTAAIRIWNGTTWTATGVTSYHRSTAAQDLMDTCKVYGTPTSGDSFEWFNSLVANEAFIDFLMVRELTLLDSGKIASENFATTGGFELRNIDDTIITKTGAKTVELQDGAVYAYGGASGTRTVPVNEAPLVTIKDGEIKAELRFSSAWQEVFRTRMGKVGTGSGDIENSSIKSKGVYTKRCLCGGTTWRATGLRVHWGSHFVITVSGFYGTGTTGVVYHSGQYMISCPFPGAQRIDTIYQYNSAGASDTTVREMIMQLSSYNIELRGGTGNDLYYAQLYADITRVGPLDEIERLFGSTPIVTYLEF